MGNHFHLLVRMHQDDEYSDEEIKERFRLYYGEKNPEEEGLDIVKILQLRKKWSSLSEYIKEIKQGFPRFYNGKHKRKGFFWSDRFTLLNGLECVNVNY